MIKSFLHATSILIGFLIFAVGMFVFLALSPLFFFAKVTFAILALLFLLVGIIYLTIQFRKWRRFSQLPSEPAFAVFQSEIVDIGEPLQVNTALVKRTEKALNAEQIKADYDFIIHLGVLNLPYRIFKTPQVTAIRLICEGDIPRMVQFGQDKFALISHVEKRVP